MFTPPVEPIAAAELGQPAGASPTALSTAAAPLALPADATSLDDAGLLALGRAAFARYPTQLAGYMRVALTSRAAASAARIPDLRPVRWLTHLHQDATLRGSDPVTLAIRLETLIITTKPSDDPPTADRDAGAGRLRSVVGGRSAQPRSRGRRVARWSHVLSFACAECHAPPGLTGRPVALAAIGTDPTLGRAADRGTGTYRGSSLRGGGRDAGASSP